MSIADLSAGAFLGFGIGFFVGLILLMVIETRHDWGKWREMRLLTIYTNDKFGDRNAEKYRRFERECKDCGTVEIKKVRID